MGEVQSQNGHGRPGSEMGSIIFAEDFLEELLKESGVALSPTVDLLVVVLVGKFLELEVLGPAGSCVLPLSLVVSGSLVKPANVLVFLEFNGEVIVLAAHVHTSFHIAHLASLGVLAPGVALFFSPKIVSTAVSGNYVIIKVRSTSCTLRPIGLSGQNSRNN